MSHELVSILIAMESRSNANVNSVLSVWPWCVVASCARRVVNAAWIAAICAAKLYDQWHRRYLSSCWRWNFSIRPAAFWDRLLHSFNCNNLFSSLLHCAFAFSGQNTPGSVNLAPISVHPIQGLFDWLGNSASIAQTHVHICIECMKRWLYQGTPLQHYLEIMLHRMSASF